MSAEKIRVNTDSLKHTQENVKSRLDGIKKDIENVTLKMSALNSVWTGTAHDTFVNEVNSDLAILNSVCDEIQAIINYEGNAVTEYNKCEKQVSDLIAQINI